MALNRGKDMLQLPSWDEQEELDYDEDPPTDDPFPQGLSPDFVEEPCSSNSVSSPRLPRMEELEGGPSRPVIGPSLPRGFLNDNRLHPEDPSGPVANRQRARPINTDSLPQIEVDPPAPPGVAVIGPSLPPQFVRDDAPSLPDDEFRVVQDPVLENGHPIPPPEPVARPERHIGPSLPPDFSLPDTTDSEPEPHRPVNGVIGPALPPQLLPNGDDMDENPPEMPDDDVEEDDVIGPSLPSSSGNSEGEYLMRLAILEHQKKIAENTPKREEWMMTLPKKLNNYGLGARTFSKSTNQSEQSTDWTDTPEQRKRKMESNGDEPSTSGRAKLERAVAEQRDKTMAAEVEKHNSKRGVALLDQHCKRQTDDAGPSSSEGRRAFDREKDMQVRGLQNASKDEIKARCGQLGSRFGHGNTQKFL